MSLATALASFFLIWWVVLFAVLPWGVRSQHEAGEFAQGTDPGAPTTFRLGRTLLWTTLVALVIFGIFYAVYASGLIKIDNLTKPYGTS